MGSLIKSLAATVLLLVGASSFAATRSAELCGDSSYHQAGYCPAVLSAPSCSDAATSGNANCSSTADVSDGTDYVCGTTSATPLTSAQIQACSGGTAVAGNSGSRSGVSNGVFLSGLTNSQATYGQFVNISPELWPSNIVVSSSFTPTAPGGGGGGVPYDLTAGGTRTIPFSYQWPTAPTTTTDVTVNDLTELNTALAAGPGRNITVSSSFGTRSGSIQIRYSDTKITFASNSRINGTGGNLWSITPGIARVHIVNGTFTDDDGPSAAGYWRSVSDILFDNVVVLGALTWHVDGLLAVGNHRIAMVNSTLDATHILTPTGGEVFPWFTYQTQRHSNFIFANVRFEQGTPTQSHATIRLQNVQNVIAVDSAFNMTNSVDGTTGWRSTYQCDDVFIADTLIAGRINNQATPIGAYNVHDITFRNVTRYTLNSSNPPAWSNDSGANNTGTVINGTIYAPSGLPYGIGSPVSSWLGAMTDGGGNSSLITAWTSLPSVTGYGADHIETY